MRRFFDEELSELYDEFLEMGSDVNVAVTNAVSAFVKHDVELAEQVIKADKYINKAEVQLEKGCFTLIALQQPVASDLRNIVAVMKASSDLERIGDHAVSIAQATIAVKGNNRILEIEKLLEEMALVVESMMTRVLKAYVSLDVEEAKRVAEEDEKVDDYLTKVVHKSTQGILENPETVTGGMEYVQVAGYLERIGDYITNICERIVYTVTGKLTELN
ncbi:phosphate signaling complex protein PhoU [Granulicatella sp. zg-ZJ]|uniref:phosphate signaling complex protein PhoU n=1 Tax=unclassified Granulicatella TaxID=2630493 RepID=UPI0013C1BDCE|nr:MULTISPECIES: phosphate signaling complex protein PhoU [unclassified Granulicatella]MBS4750752.1 phosphate signaling complex protein PhoU [Carnobacteriaceae bacterium zg-ZUI78]NEW62596.1 phosphate signaling complex protein PhoU [Granulicatella sp. zg-ZJ]NEW66701.1 phosphate signaling complex protein PhoU [Granulicatella sp. zg-84]QMI85996.1 phosphate signaling complex protein PhoU [Carnobacteriaceae bacterium zg-84]